MPQQPVSTLEGGNPIELLVVHPDKLHPLLASLADGLLQLVALGMVPNRVRVQAIYLHSPFEGLDQDIRRDAIDPDRLRHRSVHEIDTLAVELIARDPVDRDARPRHQLKETRQPGDGAAGDDGGARDEDRVEEVVGDLVVGLEALNGAYRVLVVRLDGRQKEVHGGEDVDVEIRLGFLGDEVIAVGDEFFKEREEHLGFELCRIVGVERWQQGGPEVINYVPPRGQSSTRFRARTG